MQIVHLALIRNVSDSKVYPDFLVRVVPSVHVELNMTIRDFGLTHVVSKTFTDNEITIVDIPRKLDVKVTTLCQFVNVDFTSPKDFPVAITKIFLPRIKAVTS